jgi:hypothetical protein
MRIQTIIINDTTIDVLQDIVEKIGSFAILDVNDKPSTDLWTIKLDPLLVKVVVDSDGIHILRFELGESRHCTIDCSKFGKVIIA